jgi:hypothetical protein
LMVRRILAVLLPLSLVFGMAHAQVTFERL